MNVKQLLEAIDGYDPEMEVVVRVTPVHPGLDYSEAVEDFFGEYCEVTNEKNILVEYGKLTIVADYEGFDEVS